MESDLTAYCGLYCGDCIRYRSRASDLSRRLLKELNKTGFAEYAGIKSSPEKQLDSVKEFQHYRECCEVLGAIVSLECNMPCRKGGGCPTFKCSILDCCKEQDIERCWQCPEFMDCEKLNVLKSIHGDSPLKNLEMIKEHGLNRWSEYRSKPYIWQEM